MSSPQLAVCNNQLLFGSLEDSYCSSRDMVSLVHYVEKNVCLVNKNL